MNVAKKTWQTSLNAFMRRWNGICSACMVVPHLGCDHAVRLGTWLPILQGIADKGFFGTSAMSLSIKSLQLAGAAKEI
jgi:hypothetical protein